jgi:membrane-bound ClpP family serine protease
VQVAWEIIGFMTLLTGLVIGGIVVVVLRNRRAPQLVPSASHIRTPLVPLGTVAAVRRDLLPAGSVYAAGEEWTARSRDGRPLERGTPVQVVGQDGLTLLVERSPDHGLPGRRQAGGGALLQPGDNPHAERTV